MAQDEDTFFDRQLEDETYDLGEDDERDEFAAVDKFVELSIEEFESLTDPCRRYTDNELRTMLQYARARELGQIH